MSVVVLPRIRLQVFSSVSVFADHLLSAPLDFGNDREAVTCRYSRKERPVLSVFCEDPRKASGPRR